MGILKFREILKEFFDDILDLDSRAYRTLKYLLFRPGAKRNDIERQSDYLDT